jgi:hypothetical protein
VPTCAGRKASFSLPLFLRLRSVYDVEKRIPILSRPGSGTEIAQLPRGSKSGEGFNLKLKHSSPASNAG